MRFIFLFIFCISSSYAQVEFSNIIEKKVTKLVNQYLAIDKFEYSSINSLPQLGLKENHVFKISANGEERGYFAIDKSMGQYDYFDYVVVFDQELNILAVRVLNYREDYGYEVSSRWWLSQFIGKKAGKNMRYKEDIDALSGATISAESITDSLKILSSNMLYWKDLNII